MKCMQTGAEMPDERIKIWWIQRSLTGRSGGWSEEE